jgi:hypothetical protein
MTGDGLRLWTIYSNPTDYPGKFVTRESVITAGHVRTRVTPTAVVDSLEEARAAAQAASAYVLVRQERHPSDDPKIVETWF